MWGRRPRRVRIEALHLLELVERVRPEILLVYDAVVTDDERVHSRYVILGRRSDHCEAADHDSFTTKFHSGQRRNRSLPLQDFEE